MTKPLIFRGCATALITPFQKDRPEEIDHDAWSSLVQRQAEAGVDALVVAGTTGEASALTGAEHRFLIETAKRNAPTLPVIAGCGASTTAAAAALARDAAETGADAILVVTPYYNKCSQEGLYRHYMTIADQSTVPVILYEVPSRTGMKVTLDTYIRLSAHENIAALKDATGDLERAVLLRREVGDALPLYAGSDGVTVPMLSVGAVGVISVVSNLLPAMTAEMCRLWFDGETLRAAEMQCRLAPLIRALFSEVNPIPVKAIMAALGYCADTYRLPLCEMDAGAVEMLVREYKRISETES